MYHNVHYPVAALGEGLVKSPGVCSVKIFRKEDVLQWPSFNPENGILSSAVTLKPGALIYLLESVDKTRSFTESQKSSNAGFYFDITVKANLRGSTAAHPLTLGTLMHYEWGIIVKDKNGVTRLIGNQDSCADFSYDYSSGTGSDSRKTEITLKWEHPQPAPVYTATAFDIIIGGEILTAGTIQLVIRFQVGASGAPMVDGDTLYVNSALINKNLLIVVDGIVLPIDDFSGDIDWTGSIQRHVEKALASNTIDFKGGVVNNEIIEIYAFS